MNWIPFKIKSSGHTDIGLVRSNNEDYFLENSDYFLYILADGMGGHQAGEIAAKEAVRFTNFAMEEYLISHYFLDVQSVLTALENSIQSANAWIHYLGQKKKHFRGMGTTLCAMLFFDEVAVQAHVGDSRIYCYRQGILSQLTKDHSLQNELIEKGSYLPWESDSSFYKNVLTKAVGITKTIQPDIKVHQVLPGDFFMICSDGLTDLVDKNEIKKILSMEISLKEKNQILIEKAKEMGGNDNITAILISVET